MKISAILPLVSLLLAAGMAEAQNAIAVTEALRLGAGPVRIDVLVHAAGVNAGEVEMAEITFPPGRPAAPHRHGATELLYVLQGELDHTVNGQTRRLSPGMVGIARVGDTVAHGVASAGPVRVLAIWTPAGEVERLMRGPGSGTRVPIAETAADLDGLRSLRDDWTRAYSAGDANALRDLYTDDAVRMPYDAVIQSGRDSIVAGYSRSFTARAFTPAITLTAAQIEILGDLAIERGAYDEMLTPRSGGRTLRERGKYVSLARRGDDGRWRFAWSIFNRDAPAAPL